VDLLGSDFLVPVFFLAAVFLEAPAALAAPFLALFFCVLAERPFADDLRASRLETSFFPFFALFLEVFFFATLDPSCSLAIDPKRIIQFSKPERDLRACRQLDLRSLGPAAGRSAGEYAMLEREDERVVVSSGPDGLRIEIRPLIRTRKARWRLALATVLLLASALFGAARLAQAWETGLRRGDFRDIPLPWLAALTVAVGLFAPLAVLGLAALAFAEETIQVGPESVTISTTAFERTRVRTIPLAELECWRQTLLPLSPWWTWAVERLAAKWRGRLEPLAGAAGPKEKKWIGQVLARATGRPLVDDFGRTRELETRRREDAEKRGRG